MKRVVLRPAHALLGSLTKAELVKLARRCKLRLRESQPKDSMVTELALHLGVDDVTETLLVLFSKKAVRGTGQARAAAGGAKTAGGVRPIRLDQVPRLTGTATVQAYGSASAGQGRVLLEHGGSCLKLRLPNLQLFLDNRWPVVASDAGDLPAAMLYAGYVRRARVHPSAAAPPPADRPFILDDGEYGVRQGRLRLELRRSGLLSFRVYLMRYSPRSGRPEYILQPIM